MVEESKQRWVLSLFVFFSVSMGESTKFQCQKIRLYVVNACKCVSIERTYMYIYVFYCLLCHLWEHELQWFDPGSSLMWEACCGVCCVQRGSVSHPT